MRGSSTLVSVSSVSSRPSGVGGQPAAGGQVRHAEAGGPDGHRARQLAAVDRAARRRASPRSPSRRGRRARSPRAAASRLATDAPAPRVQVRAEHPAADQGHGAALPPPVRRRSRCRSGRRRPPSPGPSRVRRRATRPQPLRLLQGGDRVGELGRAGHARVGAAAAHRVDQVVVARRCRRSPASRVRPAASIRAHGVDHQPDARRPGPSR